MSKRNIKSKEEAPINQVEIKLHGDDVAFIARTVRDSYRSRPLSEADRIETIVAKLGPIAEYRTILTPSVPTRSYLRKMVEAAMRVDVEMESVALAEEATRRARAAVACDILY
ncbi:hypothetical protein [Methylobacterium brachiatum]|uniref:hypothetical protein n=1 Tax=Methylobacterium brachiatum TaxID=269660 RepID=UPI000EFADD3F|nr:hypothetical protein [Methylobacterium brachiatum]AYO82674.1 hypothetical protein EBB05_10655 [Methylobacterium brachiatum]